jgi:hypothetical protein
MTRGTAFLAPVVLVGAALLTGTASAADAINYDKARWDPIHFKPQIDQASDAQCLVCHQEILQRKVSRQSPAGVTASEALAWYQTLDTYAGEQDTFHRRHLTSDYAKQVMTMKCNTCHQGNDPREETAQSSFDSPTDLIQRKHVDPMICVMCHGQHNATVMGLPPGDWREIGAMFNDSCLTCHVGIRTNRHQVNFLKADAIEAAAKQDTDVCFGCHGGRAWYRIVYPYPRNDWEGSGGLTPDWAKDRPTHSDPRFGLTVKQASAEPSE